MYQEISRRASAQFAAIFGGVEPRGVAVAPGRVNLIGEHTDYNDGFVLPMAIQRHVAVAFGPSKLNEITVWSEYFGEMVALPLDRLSPGSITGWAAYPAGMCWEIGQRGYNLRGMNAAVVADIPVGAGVSSSAAFEVSFGAALSANSALDLSPAVIANVAHRADNDFVGIPSGIMDQFASALAVAGEAILIDCRSSTHKTVPVPGDVVFVVMDTGKRRGLVDSEYSNRVEACRRVVSVMKSVDPNVSALRDVDGEGLAAIRGRLTAEDYDRAKHVIDENERTLQAVDALRHCQVQRFGRLMMESHVSLRDLYQVSCQELDLVVELAVAQKSCIGARMTGGGFGGCALALVHRENVGAFIKEVSQGYALQTKLQGAFFEVEPTEGVRVEFAGEEE